MREQQQLWNEKHHQYADEAWIDQPSFFSQWAVEYFPKQGKVLELGAGQGQDSRYFASLGYEVVSTDFSGEALEFSRSKITGDLARHITLQQLDLSQPFSFSDKSFDVVYAHLSIHYFDDEVTRQIFSEILRILKPGGIVVLLLNSIDDPEYVGSGKSSDGLVRMSTGMVKRFFSVESLRPFVSEFEVLELDDQGKTHKDEINTLIRFVGKVRQ